MGKEGESKGQQLNLRTSEAAEFREFCKKRGVTLPEGFRLAMEAARVKYLDQDETQPARKAILAACMGVASVIAGLQSSYELEEGAQKAELSARMAELESSRKRFAAEIAAIEEKLGQKAAAIGELAKKAEAMDASMAGAQSQIKFLEGAYANTSAENERLKARNAELEKACSLSKGNVEKARGEESIALAEAERRKKLLQDAEGRSFRAKLQAKSASEEVKRLSGELAALSGELAEKEKLAGLMAKLMAKTQGGM
jgi:chromosome segregation ATPase